MKALIIGAALALSISTVAMAEEKAENKSLVPNLSAVDFTFSTDTEYNVTNETVFTDFGVTAEMKGIDLSLTPQLSWDDQNISNVEFAAGYTFNVNDSFGIRPYGEFNLDKDFNAGDKIVGVKTTYNF